MPSPIEKVDVHIHSRFSDAPHCTISKITSACLKAGIGACITDHNEIRGSLRLFNESRVATIPAIEVGSRSQIEFLIYFDRPESLERFFVTSVEPYKRRNFYSRLDRDFEPLIREAKELGGVISLPHPFAPGWKNLGSRRRAGDLHRILAPDFLPLIDFVEVINGHLSDKRNFRAYRFATEHRVQAVVGSDAHEVEDIGKVVVEFDAPVEAGAILSTLTADNRMVMNLPFSPWKFMGTARRVFPRHVLLYLLPKNQRAWMNEGNRA